jgi:peroxiredoxin/ribosomal protein S18 acetylase RimI-like enzyme
MMFQERSMSRHEAASHDLATLPPGLPVPVDDGACLHLRRAALPPIELASTSGTTLRLDRLPRPAVLFFYPRTGVPGEPVGKGVSGESWESIPGARGCTPQSCGFRDAHAAFAAMGVDVLGVSTNTTEHQQAFKDRERVPFEFLSDSGLTLARAMRLPTFEFPVASGGPPTLVKRMAWYVEPDEGGMVRVREVWYPVFPPGSNAARVLEWLGRRAEVTLVTRSASHDAFVRAELERHWFGTQIWSRGICYDADRIPAIIAMHAGEPVGLITYDMLPGGTQCEVVTLSTRLENRGIAARLLEAVEDIARAAGAWRIFLTTTNDNLRAIGVYQRCGWQFAALHKGIVDMARERVPHIPRLGPSGIPVRDELEFELWVG